MIAYTADDASPDDITTTDDSIGEGERGSWTCDPDFLIPPCCRQRKGVLEPMTLTTACCSLTREWRSWWRPVISSLLMDLLCKLPDLVSPVCLGARPETQTEHLTVLLFGTQNSFCQYGIQSIWNIGPENWDLNFPLRVERTHYKEWLKPPFKHEAVSLKVFCCCSETGTIT